MIFYQKLLESRDRQTDVTSLHLKNKDFRTGDKIMSNKKRLCKGMQKEKRTGFEQALKTFHYWILFIIVIEVFG